MWCLLKHIVHFLVSCNSAIATVDACRLYRKHLNISMEWYTPTNEQIIMQAEAQKEMDRLKSELNTLTAANKAFEKSHKDLDAAHKALEKRASGSESALKQAQSKLKSAEDAVASGQKLLEAVSLSLHSCHYAALTPTVS